MEHIPPVEEVQQVSTRFGQVCLVGIKWLDVDVVQDAADLLDEIQEACGCLGPHSSGKLFHHDLLLIIALLQVRWDWNSPTSRSDPRWASCEGGGGLDSHHSAGHREYKNSGLCTVELIRK